MDTATTGPVTVFCDDQAVLAESIVWSPGERLLRWTDITLGTLTTASADGTVRSVVPLPPPLASFQPRATGGFVAALGDTVVLTDADGVVERELARVQHATAGIRFNEGKCDPFGRFVVGSMDLGGDDPAGALYAVDPDGSVRTLRGGFGVANGFEWTGDGSEMFVTDTSTSTIYRAPYGPDGELGSSCRSSAARRTTASRATTRTASGRLSTARAGSSGGGRTDRTWRRSRCRHRT